MLNRGGKREGAGHPLGKPNKPEAEKVKPRKISLTDKEYKQFLKNGGARWLRSLLGDV